MADETLEQRIRTQAKQHWPGGGLVARDILGFALKVARAELEAAAKPAIQEVRKERKS